MLLYRYFWVMYSKTRWHLQVEVKETVHKVVVSNTVHIFIFTGGNDPIWRIQFQMGGWWPATRNGQHLVGSTLSMKPSPKPSSQKSCGKRFGMHCSGLWKQWHKARCPRCHCLVQNGGEFAIWRSQKQGQQIPKAMIYAITGDQALGATAAWSDIT